mgnify:CR=1 FL=1
MSNILSSVDVKNVINSESGEMPWGLYHPQSEGKLTWTCGPDAEGKITSVYCCENERDASYISEERAREIKKGLEDAGWKKLVPPKIKFTIPDEKGRERPLNRKEQRYIERKISQGVDITKLGENKRGKR